MLNNKVEALNLRWLNKYSITFITFDVIKCFANCINTSVIPQKSQMLNWGGP